MFLNLNALKKKNETVCSPIPTGAQTIGSYFPLRHHRYISIARNQVELIFHLCHPARVFCMIRENKKDLELLE